MKLSRTIGNTPLIKVSDRIWAKFEGSNPRGSIKDRVSSWILSDARNKKLIKEGDTIIEATSGNTGISLSMLGAERGYKVVIVMPSNMSDERKKMLKFYGAELIEVEAGNFDMAIRVRDELSKEFGYFNTNQFHNPINVDCHYATTGVEILEQFENKIGAFVAGLSLANSSYNIEIISKTRPLKDLMSFCPDTIRVQPYFRIPSGAYPVPTGRHEYREMDLCWWGTLRFRVIP